MSRCQSWPLRNFSSHVGQRALPELLVHALSLQETLLGKKLRNHNLIHRMFLKCKSLRFARGLSQVNALQVKCDNMSSIVKFEVVVLIWNLVKKVQRRFC